MILNLQIGPKNKILRTKSQKVIDFNNPKLKKIISDIKETLDSTDNGIGLAAPQIGENIRLFILSPSLGENTVFINPVISKSLRQVRVQEGCLSLPKIYGFLKRSKTVKVVAFDENGKKFKLKAEGLLAQAIQHEVDHLDGILFIDKTKELYLTEDSRLKTKQQ